MSPRALPPSFILLRFSLKPSLPLVHICLFSLSLSLLSPSLSHFSFLSPFLCHTHTFTPLCLPPSALSPSLCLPLSPSLSLCPILFSLSLFLSLYLTHAHGHNNLSLT